MRKCKIFSVMFSEVARLVETISNESDVTNSNHSPFSFVDMSKKKKKKIPIKYGTYATCIYFDSN